MDVWKVAAESVRARYPDLREPELHKLIIRDVIDRQVRDVIVTSAEQIVSAKVQSRDDVGISPFSFDIATNWERRIVNCGSFFIKMSIIIPAWRRLINAPVRCCEKFSKVTSRSESARGCGNSAYRKRRVASNGMRLYRGHDRSIFNGGICQTGE